MYVLRDFDCEKFEQRRIRAEGGDGLAENQDGLAENQDGLAENQKEVT
jgi:hypothetical protein